ncbi:MAG: DUF481 domain-containing protein [Campylobacterota bacterium]|nr:DUF481 domain-containing protein [Campylobacterota bacterium]
MKYALLISFLFFLPLFAQDSQEVVKDEKKPELIEVKDTSGLSESEVRKIAEDEVKASIFQTPWEEMSPTPKAFDWVQAKSGEWFKGKIKAMYNDKLEFDSSEIDLYTFKFKDIIQIKSFNVIGVNIEDVAIFTGIIRFKDDEITIIQGDKVFKFNRSEIISLAPENGAEFNYWSAKISLSIDVRQGNKEQYDYTAKANVKRRTSSSNLYFDYLGRISSRDSVETANDHRLNQKYDRYITRQFFWTPLFSEFYQDKFQNIRSQFTGGIGLGYTLVDNEWAEWDVSGGPAYTRIKYISVSDGSPIRTSAALEVSTKVDLELSSRVDFKYDYKITLTDEKAGRYKHHMVSTLENELTSWLDIDFTFVWDYTLYPEETSSGELPAKSDYQFLVGLGIEF